MTPNPKIAILGAGPAGLCLAAILTRHSIPYVLYESDTSSSSRTQGGSLDLHPTTGQRALREAGLFEAWEQQARFSGENLVLTDGGGREHVRVQGVAHGRPEIGRPKLRRMLLEAVPAERVRWGRRVERVGGEEEEEEEEQGGVLRFEDGTVEEGFDLVVGADGAWSKVRPRLSSLALFYAGVTGVEMAWRGVDERYPEISERIGEGSNFMFGEERGHALLCQRQDDRSIQAYAWFTVPEHFVRDSGVDWADPQKVKGWLLKKFEGWSEGQRDLIRKADDDMTPRPLYMLPVGLKWPSRKGLTVIGDAAHLMTPFAGEGVNLALTDAMVLAQEIVKSPDDLDRAVQAYEKEMFPRAAESQQRTWHSLQARFAPGAIAEFKNRVAKTIDRLGLDRKQFILTDIGTS
ncbi:MAG: hypothetical protein Q9165_005134 [Trypethelium subeluteriae]